MGIQCWKIWFYQRHVYQLQLDNNVAKMNNVAAAGLTNRTACVDGWFNGWKDWCNNNAKGCLQNLLVGKFPAMILKAHEQYLAGEKAANNSGTSMCPIGSNAAFCAGYDNNNDDYGGVDCGDSNQYANPMYNHIVGCPFDTLKRVGNLPMLVGTWNYVNESKGTMGNMDDMQSMPMTAISGKIVYGANGDVNMTIPNKSGFGDYQLQASWGYIGPNILVQCMPSGACENNTLTTVTPNHTEFTDNHGDTIHLMRNG
jgi:hypothetical protein